MPTADAFAANLLELYKSEIRPFLEENQVSSLSALDQNAELLERAIAQTGTLKVGFVGESQVGKSTLVNALLDRQALPAGGIGPLTAQATRVSYSEENALSVAYHSRQQLHQHAFAIARYLERRGELKKAGDAEASLSDDVAEDEVSTGTAAERLVIAFQDDDGDGGSASGKEDLGRYMLNQAKRILCSANPDAPADASNLILLDGLRAALDQKTIVPDEDLAPIRPRIAAVKALLGAQEELSETTEGGASPFNRALRLRAAGWMSPLVSELSLKLRCKMLESTALVDLPGIGVLNDAAGQEAEKFVRTEGDALVIVFRNSGLTENVAELLERTGVITKLLFGGTGDVPPIQVIIAVTYVDVVAKADYSAQCLEAAENDEAPPDRSELFRLRSGDMVRTVQEMVGDALRRSPAFEDLPEDQRAARERVVAELVRSMKILCVASPDYLDLVQGSTHGLTFLTDPEATNIPELRRYLVESGRAAAGRRRQLIAQYEHTLTTALRDHLAAIAQMYEEGQGAATQAFERFCEHLTSAAEPLRLEMKACHGEAIGVLRKAMTAELDLVCKEAEIAGMKKLQRLTTQGGTLHFMALKAALVRNGVWERRGVNYPEALTLAMVDSIASQWEPRIIERIRAEVRTLADRDLKLVERLCAEASALDPRIVAESPIEAQKRILQANSRTAIAWTRDHLDELRNQVSKTLRQAVEKPIERACSRAVKAGEHRGPGAKGRILGAFAEGGNTAIEEARDKAGAALKEQYQTLLRKLNDGFLKDNHDPVQTALDTLTGEQVARARRSDGARKRIVAGKVAKFLSELARDNGTDAVRDADAA